MRCLFQQSITVQELLADSGPAEILKQLFARSRWFEGKRDSFKKIKIPRGNCLFAISPLVYRKNLMDKYYPSGFPWTVT